MDLIAAPAPKPKMRSVFPAAGLYVIVFVVPAVAEATLNAPPMNVIAMLYQIFVIVGLEEIGANETPLSSSVK